MASGSTQQVDNSSSSSAAAPLDARHRTLNQWAAQALGYSAPLVSQPLGGDASFRRYFRHWRANGSTILLVDAPPEQENNPAFVLAAGEFRAADLPVPHILTCDLDQGFLMLEDFGDLLYLPALQAAQAEGDHAAADGLYHQAMRALLQLQRSPLPSALPDYDRPLLERELRLFDEWFCERMLGMTLSAAEQQMLGETWNLLIEAALRQPQVRVHRDYHSRNLMIRSSSGRSSDSPSAETDEAKATPRADALPGIIDFQDAVVGPITYDLVSLLRDCYIVWPDHDVERWLQAFHQAAQAQEIITACHGLERFRRDFDLMGLQRHIKVLGIFCRLYLRDGKQRYLADLPVVMQYVVDVAGRHPEMAAFLAWLKAGPMRALQQRLAELGVDGAGADVSALNSAEQSAADRNAPGQPGEKATDAS